MKRIAFPYRHLLLLLNVSVVAAVFAAYVYWEIARGNRLSAAVASGVTAGLLILAIIFGRPLLEWIQSREIAYYELNPERYRHSAKLQRALRTYQKEAERARKLLAETDRTLWLPGFLRSCWRDYEFDNDYAVRQLKKIESGNPIAEQIAAIEQRIPRLEKDLARARAKLDALKNGIVAEDEDKDED